MFLYKNLPYRCWISYRVGLLDNMTEDQLDKVDEQIFDRSINLNMRVEYLRFLLDPIEGFENINTEEEAGKSDDAESFEALILSKYSKKPRRKSGSSSTETGQEKKLMAMRKRHALQLETIAEFVEHHLLSNNSQYTANNAFYLVDNYAHFLVEAILCIPNFRKFYYFLK